MPNNTVIKNQNIWGGETHPVAVLVCAIGFFMHILLSAPVLNILGIQYGSENAGFLGKIHPGSYFILASFVILLVSRRNPIEQLIAVARQQSAFFAFFSIYVLIIVYWLLRSPKGIGIIPDTHLIIPLTAIVFSYAPRLWYKKIVYLFISFAIVNAAIGIFESSTHLRIFPFNPEWELLKQDYFRASALMGHPLNNAAFDSLAIFILLNMRLALFWKSIFFLILLIALIGFGGRAALIFSCAGLLSLGIFSMMKYIVSQRLTVLRITLVILALFLIPSLCGGMLYGALHSSMGERLTAFNGVQDDSASIRVASARALDFMTNEDMIFGMDDDGVSAIGAKVGIVAPTTDIENPWILMFMFLGGIMFVLWLCGLGGFIWRLMAGASPILKIAVIDYFLIASTSNSFGRRDSVFMLMVGIVVCAKNMDLVDRQTIRLVPAAMSAKKPTIAHKWNDRG